MSTTASAVTNTFSAPGVLMAENFADVLDSRFAFVKRRMWQEPVEGLKFWNVLSTNKAYEKHSYVTSAGIVPKSRDVDEMPLTNIIQGFDQTYTPETYRLGLRIEQRLRETDQFRVIDKQMQDLNQSTRDTIELSAVLPFNTAFSTTVEWTCADGMNLCDKLRKYEDPSVGTWDNEETSSVMTQAAVATMRLNFRKNKSERGRRRPLIMDKIIIPSDLEDTAITVLKSVQKAGVSLNDKNFLTEYRLSYQVWNYLTSSTYWFGSTKKDSNYELFWYWGVKPTVNSYDCGNPNVYCKYIRMVFGTGADRPHSIRGNVGV